MVPAYTRKDILQSAVVVLSILFLYTILALARAQGTLWYREATRAILVFFKLPPL